MLTIGAYVSNNIQDEIHSFLQGLSLDKNVYLFERQVRTSKYYNCNILVTHGTYKPLCNTKKNIKRLLQKHHRDFKKPHIIIEGGYLKKGSCFSVGINGLNGRANFCNQNSPSDRWKKFNMELKSWRKDGEHILVVEQVITDSSVCHTDFTDWVYKTIKNIRQHTNRPIIYRIHPKNIAIARLPLPAKEWKAVIYDKITDKILKHWECLAYIAFHYDDIIISQNENPEQIKNLPHYQAYNNKLNGLEKDLENCWCVVTFNSNVGVDATLAGIPVITHDKGSMVYNITSHDISTINNPYIPNDELRQQWAYDTAYAEWSPDELKSGEAWQHIKPCILKILKRKK